MAELFFGDFRFDTRRLALEGPDGPVEVRAKTLQALIYLIEHRNRFVSRGELMKVLWPDVHVTDASVTQCVSELRHALGDSAGSPLYIETKVKVGYRFVATLYHKPTEVLEPLPPPPEADPGKIRKATALRRWWPVAAVLGALMIGGAIVVRMFPGNGDSIPVAVDLSVVAVEGSGASEAADALREALTTKFFDEDRFEAATPGEQERLSAEVTVRETTSGRMEVDAVLRVMPEGREIWGWTWVIPADESEATAGKIADRIVTAAEHAAETS